ncbi:MAG TPA: hypothetical protein DEO56_11930 [Nitrosomonas nitrosa]|jgi:hypothetical protein|uniref:Uncharacterized protein n=1 Tax=Nitrosomonas nitrosa TaxID=52442 RepID=A0A1I4Q9M5_9PROT|nr:hypothetical protein [Nitrosomonas nitrosa]MCO6433940.1 hypothetical protein [Nitrosomonas nitrosa]PTQ95454.1 hypothetical protein C8R30_11444 [Nitrosomonas nitrosa]CAE6501051.1 conserved hypothetical protein [Nitrosomonas nitrosa]SFM36802.1 hypothetical protein SAMN05421880_11437 [Nitrosomonas nitrosa]HBZ31279.1 hypothetical protein [Nitrosomonas nitrosa]
MSEDKVKKQTDLGRDSPDNTLQQSRRRLLKNSVAIPVIMTLSSGAAHAVTSNLVSPSETDIFMVDEQVACFDIEEAVVIDDLHTKYDLGESNSITYTLEEDVMACSNRQDMYGPGIVISSAAYSSLSGRPNVQIMQRML